MSTTILKKCKIEDYFKIVDRRLFNTIHNSACTICSSMHKHDSCNGVIMEWHWWLVGAQCSLECEEHVGFSTKMDFMVKHRAHAAKGTIGNDHEKAQSERSSHSQNLGGKILTN